MIPGFGGFQAQSIQPVEIDASTPFMAAADGDLTLLQTSIKQLNLSANIIDSNGFTLLHAACGYSRIEVINWLIDLNNNESTIIDVNARDSDNDTPLHHCDDVDSARILIEKGGADHQLTNNEGKTPLQSKEAELEEEDDDDDSDGDEDREKLKQLVVYLKSLSV